MAQPSTLYRFRVQLSDVDRGLYESFEVRLAKHPSESVPYLLTRVIAYSLNFQEGLKLTQGIGNPDEPALEVRDLTGVTKIWIEVGNPSARRLHKASKAADQVRVYTYRDPDLLVKEAQGETIYRAESIEVFSLAPSFLSELGETLDRDNDWQLLHTEGELSLTVKDRIVHGEIRRHSLIA
jgi:uncharacterized protein YaeQ